MCGYGVPGLRVWGTFVVYISSHTFTIHFRTLVAVYIADE